MAALIRYPIQTVNPKNQSICCPLTMLALAVLLIVGCSNEEGPGSQAVDTTLVDSTAERVARTTPLWQEAAYRDWTSVTSGSVVLYFPEYHQHAAEMPGFAQGYAGAVATVTERLGVVVPVDTVRVYHYTGPGQAEAITGQSMPFGDSTGVHYWTGYSRGVSLMQYLLPKAYGLKSSLPIMYHGLVALFDFAGENYHQTTLEYANDTFFIPLTRLANDTLMNSASERYQSAEAASFVGFLLGEYGPAAVRTAYVSNLPFDSTIASVCGISIDSLQSEWLAYAREAAPDTASRATP